MNFGIIMNILVLNGSPKGENSITLQTILYLEKLFPEHHFEIVHAGQKINSIKRNFDPVRKQIEQAYYNAVASASRWEAAKKSVEASNEAYRFTEEKHESGRANSYELFLAKNNQTQALGEEAQAKYEYAFRLKILELLKD